VRQQFLKIFFLFLVCEFAIAKELTLKEMAANLIIIGFDGTNLNEAPQLISDINSGLGGVIVFDKDPNSKGFKNIKSPMQLKLLTKKLQKFGKNRLIIAIDQEGGKVQRLKRSNGFVSTPTAEAISKMTIEKASKYYEKISRVMYENGINTNFAPVVDLAIEPRNKVIYKLKRSYGKNQRFWFY